VFNREPEGWEYLMNLAAALIAIACVGPGEWSLDNAIDYVPSNWWGLIIALVVGVGGAATLLAVFWRPPPPKPAAS
jgi:putative oxidoreductase